MNVGGRINGRAVDAWFASLSFAAILVAAGGVIVNVDLATEEPDQCAGVVGNALIDWSKA